MKVFISVLKYVIFLGLGLGIFFYVYPLEEIDPLMDKLKSANYWYVLPVVIIAIASHFARAYRWRMLIEPVGHKVKTFSTFRSIMIGYYFNTLVPRMGEVSRCVALNKIEKVPVSTALGTVITERIFDLISLMLIVGITVLAQFDIVGEYILNLFSEKLNGIQSSFSWQTILFIAGFLLLLGLLYFLVKKMGVYDKILNLISEFKKGLFSVKNLKSPLLFIGYTIFIWLGYYFMCYLSFMTVDGTSHLGLSAGLVVFTLSTIGFIAPVPGGVGTYQFMFTLALSFYFIDDLSAKTVAMIAFMGNTLLNLIVGAICLFFSPKKSTDDAPQAVS